MYLGKQVVKKKNHSAFTSIAPDVFFFVDTLVGRSAALQNNLNIWHAQRHSARAVRELPGARRARWEGKRSAGGPQRRRWLRRGSTGQRCISCSETAREEIGGKNGVADPADPAAGRVGVGDRRMVLRPPPEHLRERASPLPVAAAALPPVHALHGERCSPLLSILQPLSGHI